MNLSNTPFSQIATAPYQSLSVFTVHGTPKQISASRRRPGNYTGNHKPSCTAKQAEKFVTFGRNRKRRVNFLNAMSEINQKAGGEPRTNRRAMARSLAKRMHGAQAVNVLE